MDQQHIMEYFPIVMMLVVALGFVGLTMVSTHLLGPKRKTKTKMEAFECGIDPIGNARIPFSIKYFLVAILFVLFDVEVIFMYPWAILFKDLMKEQGIMIFVEMIVFISLLLVGFLYIIKKGALKWE
jgi:NADH-quinone oxidoreductase subunit A